MSQEKVKKAAIASAVQVLASLVDSKSIAWANKAFTPPTAKPWVSVHYLPGKPETVTMGDNGEEELSSMLQFDINIPTDSGEKAQSKILEELENFYTPGKSFSNAGQTITFRVCARSNGRVSNLAFWMVPLTVTFFGRYNRK